MDLAKLEKLAKNLAQKSNHHKYKYGCILFHRHKIISTGWNIKRTHPKSPHPWKHTHAEFYTILGVPANELEGASIFVYMERKNNGSKGIGKPCKFCNRMLEDCGIKEVIYSTNEGYDTYSYY